MKTILIVILVGLLTLDKLALILDSIRFVRSHIPTVSSQYEHCLHWLNTLDYSGFLWSAFYVFLIIAAVLSVLTAWLWSISLCFTMLARTIVWVRRNFGLPSCKVYYNPFSLMAASFNYFLCALAGSVVDVTPTVADTKTVVVAANVPIKEMANASHPKHPCPPPAGVAVLTDAHGTLVGLASRVEHPKHGVMMVTALHCYTAALDQDQNVHFYKDGKVYTAKPTPLMISVSADMVWLQFEANLYSVLGLKTLKFDRFMGTNNRYVTVFTPTISEGNLSFEMSSSLTSGNCRRLTYKASTNRGSSGSPIMANGKVVGIHLESELMDDQTYLNSGVALELVDYFIRGAPSPVGKESYYEQLPDMYAMETEEEYDERQIMYMSGKVYTRDIYGEQFGPDFESEDFLPTDSYSALDRVQWSEDMPAKEKRVRAGTHGRKWKGHESALPLNSQAASKTRGRQTESLNSGHITFKPSQPLRPSLTAEELKPPPTATQPSGAGKRNPPKPQSSAAPQPSCPSSSNTEPQTAAPPLRNLPSDANSPSGSTPQSSQPQPKKKQSSKTSNLPTQKLTQDSGTQSISREQSTQTSIEG